jgi:glycosyltransferase involved in cell wall biosynthesis
LKISVITATYNCQDTLIDTLESVFSQSHHSVESIVIDGASTDGTLAVLESYRSRLNVLISEQDKGIYDALNKGIRNATGDVIGFLHADDVFENSEVLAKIATAFQDAAVLAVYGDLVYVRHGDIGQVIRYWKSGFYNDEALSRGWMPPHPTFYVRRSVYERLGAFDVRYRIAADYDSIVRFLAVEKIHTVYIPEVLVRMRAGGISNRSLKTIIRKTLEDYDVVRRNQLGGVGTLLLKNFTKISQFWRRNKI